jgi:hypothetical protein
MKTWICPKCLKSVKALASEVTHRCPNMKQQIVAFVPEPSEEIK